MRGNQPSNIFSFMPDHIPRQQIPSNHVNKLSHTRRYLLSTTMTNVEHKSRFKITKTVPMGKLSTFFSIREKINNIIVWRRKSEKTLLLINAWRGVAVTEPKLIYHECRSVAFIWRQFHRRGLIYQVTRWDYNKITFYLTVTPAS